MHSSKLEEWSHDHLYHNTGGHGERSTWRVIILTVGMMVVEIIAGMLFGSMALLADGWHMGTHAVALGITVFAYGYARRHADNPLFSFGTGKVGVLGGFASAVVLAVVALLMAGESIHRMLLPVPIRFNEAIAVAVIGLVVNVVSAFMLHGGGHHDHAHHDHDHAGEHDHHHDYNLRAAYLHVMADALTSVLAIVALLAGKALGWVWLDPCMGIIGAVLILRWSYGLLRDTSKILLDSGIDPKTIESIRVAIESDSDNRLVDLHLWRVSAHHYAAILAIVTHFPKGPDHYKSLLASIDALSHVTVEVHACLDEPCLP